MVSTRRQGAPGEAAAAGSEAEGALPASPPASETVTTVPCRYCTESAARTDAGRDKPRTAGKERAVLDAEYDVINSTTDDVCFQCYRDKLLPTRRAAKNNDEGQSQTQPRSPTPTAAGAGKRAAPEEAPDSVAKVPKPAGGSTAGAGTTVLDTVQEGEKEDDDEGEEVTVLVRAQKDFKSTLVAAGGEEFGSHVLFRTKVEAFKRKKIDAVVRQMEPEDVLLYVKQLQNLCNSYQHELHGVKAQLVQLEVSSFRLQVRHLTPCPAGDRQRGGRRQAQPQ